MATYLKFHQLERSPFEGSDSNRLVLATESLRRAFADIKKGLDEGAPRICLSGGPGIGKSSLSRALPKLLGTEVRCALVRDPSAGWSHIKAVLTKQLHLEAGQVSRASLVAARPPGHRLVVVIDQAEQLPAEALEPLDALLGYQDDAGDQLMQCVLLANLEDAPRGQDVPLLWWLDQLTTRQLMMAPIPASGMRSYVDKHLQKAGAADTSIFEDAALVAIHRYTGGVPGAVSALCEQLLGKAASKKSRIVTASLVASVFGEAPPPAEEPSIDLGDDDDASSLFDHSNTPPAYEPDPPSQRRPEPVVASSGELPRFGDRLSHASKRAAAAARAAREPELETELRVEQGLLPVDEDSYREDADFFSKAPSSSRAGARPTASMPRVPPGSGRSARLVRNLILLAVLAVVAAFAHAYWNGMIDLDEFLFDAPSVARHATPEIEEAAIHPLVPPDERELARRSLALEARQGAEEASTQDGLTEDLRLHRDAAAGEAGEGPAAPDLDQLAEQARQHEGEPTAPARAGGEFSPWTQQGPDGGPAAPAPRR